MQATWRFLRQGDRSLATCRLLALENHTDSDTFHLSHTSLYVLYILYIRPFLIVVLQQQHVKNVTIDIAGSVACKFFNGQIYAQNLIKSAGKKFAIPSILANVIAKSMFVTPKVRQKGVCYVTSPR